jgi:hypothetical protein
MTTPEQEAGPQPSAEAAQAAEQQRLGALRQAFSPEKRSFFGKYKDTGNRVYEFEVGLVCQLAGHAPVAFRFDQIVRALQNSSRHYVNGAYSHTAFDFLLVRADEATIRFGGEYRQQELAGALGRALAGKQRRWDPRLHAFGRAVCEYVSRARLPEALEALARGESLTFGGIVISTVGVQSKDGVMPWSSIRSVEIKDGTVRIRQEGKSRSQAGAPVGNIPNLPLLMTLVEGLRQGTLPQSASPQ